MRQKKIVLVGPAYPYKGGIAHYTGLLCQTLAKKYKILLFSFKMQYPNFVFPGAEQKDFSNSNFKVENTYYLINSINPLTWIHVVIKIIIYKPLLLIIPWWNPFLAPCFSFIALFSKLFIKCKVLFICHNILPHEKLPMQRILAKITLSMGDYFIVHSLEDQDNLLQLKPEAKFRRSVHPTYNAFKNDKLSKKQTKKLLKVDRNKVLLYFGFVREYKGLMFLINAMPKIIQCYPDIVLMIVGEFFQDKYKYLERINTLNLEGNIKVYDFYVPDEEVGKFFKASDIVILPYISATQSGIVQIAYAFDKPVIVTNVGGLPEVVENHSTGYIVEPGNSNQIANAVIDFYKEGNLVKLSSNIKKQKERFSWDRLIENIEALEAL